MANKEIKINLELKEKIRQAKITKAELADFLGIAESTLFTRLRHKLTQDQEYEIADAIEQIQTERGTR